MAERTLKYVCSSCRYELNLSTESDIEQIVCPNCGDDLRRVGRSKNQSKYLWDMSLIFLGITTVLLTFGGDSLYLNVFSLCSLLFSCMMLLVSCFTRVAEEILKD